MLSKIKYYIMAFVAGCLAIVYVPFGFVYTLLGFRFAAVFQDSILLGLAITIDIAGNICGLPLYHLFAIEKNGDTLFCKKGITISASIGHLIFTKNINSFGLSFSGLLSKVFKEPDHCTNAYNLLNTKQ